jgi:hypothetical protein
VLLAIVLAIVVLAAAGDTDLGRIVALVVLAAALLLALRIADVPVRTQRRATVLVAVALASALAAPLTGRATTGFENALSLVFVGLTPVVLANRLVQNPDVTAQTFWEPCACIC